MKASVLDGRGALLAAKVRVSKPVGEHPRTDAAPGARAPRSDASAIRPRIRGLSGRRGWRACPHRRKSRPPGWIGFELGRALEALVSQVRSCGERRRPEGRDRDPPRAQVAVERQALGDERPESRSRHRCAMTQGRGGSGQYRWARKSSGFRTGSLRADGGSGDCNTRPPD
jgi:hypothetical protein